MSSKVKSEYFHYEMRCNKCGKKVLIEGFRAGTDHTISLGVTCSDCLEDYKVTGAFRKEHPVDARNIEEWIATE